VRENTLYLGVGRGVGREDSFWTFVFAGRGEGGVRRGHGKGLSSLVSSPVANHRCLLRRVSVSSTKPIAQYPCYMCNPNLPFPMLVARRIENCLPVLCFEYKQKEKK
jgi:hypothetical protein